jgi:trk system potassium uptake protein TrkA
MPSVDTRVAAIYRRNRAIVPTGTTVIEADDEVFFIAAKADIRAVMSELRRLEVAYKRITIAGGGNIGLRLAKMLEGRYNVRVIEYNKNRCIRLSEQLDRAIVIQGSASDKDLLMEESIEETDVFLALTNDDEANIMSSMLAKRLGARKVMTLINNPAYVDVVQGGDIDIAISPQTTTIGSLLTHVRRGDIVNVHSLRRGAAEAIEIIAHGDAKSSKVVGKALEDIDLPEGAKEVPAEYKGQAWARLGVNVDQNFEPLYVVPASKKQHVAKLKQALKEAQEEKSGYGVKPYSDDNS